MQICLNNNKRVKILLKRYFMLLYLFTLKKVNGYNLVRKLLFSTFDLRWPIARRDRPTQAGISDEQAGYNSKIHWVSCGYIVRDVKKF